MTTKTIRFSRRLWDEIQESATQEGVSASQWIRETTYARLCFEAGERGQPMKAEALRLGRELREREDELHLSDAPSPGKRASGSGPSASRKRPRSK